uniref:RING-CH-type domain-containing protein n=1 Tax=Parastrongyloides trichosuri TaxID=131310 RepID=A0A0N4ZBL0_PARTI
MNENDSIKPLCDENLLKCQICKNTGTFLTNFQYEPSNGMALFHPCKCNVSIHWRCWLRFWYNHRETYFRFCKVCGEFYQFNFGKEINLKKQCFICKQKFFMGSKRYPLQDTRWIKPCTCDKKVHHGCIISIYDLYKKCPDCNCKPVLKTYGSILDMIKRYSCTTTLFITLLISGVTLLYSFVYFFLYNHNIFYRNVIFFIVLGIYISTFIIIVVRFYYSRYPKFRKRYANKVVIGKEQV